MSSRRVRICPKCGDQFERSVLNCPNDQSDLLGEPIVTVNDDEPVTASATPDGTVRAPRAAVATDNLILELVDHSSTRFEVAPGQTVGRTGKSDVVLNGVPNQEYISSRMVQFSKRGDQWFVQHIACTNYIEVDSVRYEDDSEIALHEGSILSLALCPFIVRLRN